MNDFLNSLPTLSLVSLFLTMVFLLGAWVFSIQAAYQSDQGEGLRLLTILPITNPLAVLLLFLRDRQSTTSVILAYTMALLTLPVGGWIAHRAETSALLTYQEALSDRGISLSKDPLIPRPVPDSENVWSHPFLELLAQAGTSSEAGKEARDKIQSQTEDSPYRLLERVPPLKGLRFTEESPAGPLRSPSHESNHLNQALRLALDILHLRQREVTADRPETWPEVGRIISAHFEPAAGATRQLEEALARPYDHYPFQWDLAFEMLLPHLATLKAFSFNATHQSQAASLQGNSADAFRYIRLGLTLSQAGDSDLLISRLVQFAQSIITLNAVRTAQQFHSGTDAQWQAVAQQLEALDFPSLISASLSTERILAQSAVQPLLEATFVDSLERINQLGTTLPLSQQSSSEIETALRTLLNGVVSSHSRATIAKNWRLALEAYQGMIDNVDAANQRAASQPWNQNSVAALPKPIKAYGILAALMLPALEKAFDKAIETQHQIDLAEVAITLERYYLVHHRYPEALSDLTPAYMEKEPLDPMTGEPWQYQREGNRGFLLYSVGKNGRDEQGNYRAGRGSSGKGADDRAWFIHSEVPPLPEFTIPDPGDRKASEKDDGEPAESSDTQL